MTESLHPHENKGNEDDVMSREAKRLDPSDLERHKLLEQFLSQCNHPGLKEGDEVADFIISTLRSGPDDPWGYSLVQLKSDFDIETAEEMTQHDAIYARILDLIIQTKAKAVPEEGISLVRKALLELMDFRSGIIAQFDRKLLMNEQNENRWNRVLDKVVPESKQ